MSLFEIIKALQSASGTKNKQTILEQHKGNELLKAYMRATYDPALSYYQKKIVTAKTLHVSPSNPFSQTTIDQVIGYLAERKDTGDKAKATLSMIHHSLSGEGKELLELLIDRSIGAGIGDTMVLKTWPGLFFCPPYMRCSLLDKKTLKHFPDGSTFVSQEKADGQYCSLYLSGKAFTRAGNAYPAWLVHKLLTGIYQNAKGVLLGEVLVRNGKTGEVLSRQEGNGIVTSALKGADEEDFKEYFFFMKCWDMLPEEDFEAGFCETPYDLRLKEMHDTVDWCMENVAVIQTNFVRTLEEAFAINNLYISEGREGSVIKTLSHTWKNHTSPYNVKLKVVFEIDLEVEDIVEGTGKAAGMMGAVKLKSSCGKLRTDVGTGFSDKQRKDIWEFGLPKIVTIKANDIIGKRGSDTFSCFLPVFLEERLDKSEANSYDECVAILNSAKGLQ